MERIKKSAILFIASVLLVLLSFLILHLFIPLRANIEFSTVVTDDKDNVIHAFLTKDHKWRMKTELHEVSPLLRKTLILKEDRYFYYHPGVNPLAMIRAAAFNILKMKRTSGASTITMQVARMLDPKPRTYINKILEIINAVRLELNYSKDEILQLYFNLVPYGGNIEGVKSASVLFFKKNPDHLTLAEVTALSIIPNRPSSLRLGVNNDKIVNERNKWLKRFELEKAFDSKLIRESIEEPLHVTRNEAPKAAPHLSIKLRQVQNKGHIKTYLNMQVQQKTEKLVSDYAKTLNSTGIENCAVIIMENSTRHVIAYVGSADFTNAQHSGQVNGAAANRQPGSTLKPLIYGLSFDRGLLTPKTVITDVPLNLNGFQPENYDQKYHGYVTTEFALKNSLNIPAVKTLDQIGTTGFFSSLKQCGFRQIAKDEKKLGLSAALGGCGVTLEELTSIYGTLANGGTYKPLLLCESNSSLTQDSLAILSPTATYMLTDILSKYDRTDMPVTWTNSLNTPKIAWKTGTSYGRKDAWSIGYNKKYTIGVWVGNFSGEGVPELTGASIATPILFRIFNTIDYKSTSGWFSMPKECGLRIVCSESGKLPGPFCTNQVTDQYIPLVSSNANCNAQREITVDEEEKVSYCKNCQPENGYKKKVYTITPPEMQYFFDVNKIAYVKIPPHNPDCEKVFTDGAPFIRFPVNGTAYFISKEKPEPLQLRCDATGDVKRVFWYVNNKLIAQCTVNATPFFTPDEGKTKISCTDDKGRNSDIFITVKYVGL